MVKLSSISIGVRHLKNSFAPINRLPPETLALIPSFRESERELINAAAVCKYWRTTLVSTPSLWNNIVCFQLMDRDTIGLRIHTYFERSRSLPVNVQIPAWASRFLSPYIERISGLTLNIDVRSDFDEIANHLSKSAPFLKTMTLYTAGLRDRVGLPPRIFEPLLSSASVLIIHGPIFSSAPCKLFGLTRFNITTDSTEITRVALLDILEQMPFLQVFDATFYCKEGLDPVLEDRVVTLPYLEDIKIKIYDLVSPLAANSILPALSLPNALRVHLYLPGSRGAPITTLLPHSFEKQLPNLSVISRASAGLDEGFSTINFYGTSGSNLTLSIKSNELYTFPRSLFGGTPFGSVRRFDISFRSSTVNTFFFIRLLRFMGGLESLWMMQNTAGPLACWIGQDKQAGICPTLASLTIDMVGPDFREVEKCVEVLKRVRVCAGVPIAVVRVARG